MLATWLLLAHAAAPLVPPTSHAAGDTTRWTVWNHGRVAGELVEMRRGDSVIVRWRYQDRQRGPRQELRGTVDGGGEPRTLAAFALDLRGNALPVPIEQVTWTRDSVHWRAGGDSGAAPASRFHRLRNGNPLEHARFARWLLSQPNGTGTLSLGTRARASVVADTTITDGRTTRRVRLVFIDSLSPAPLSLWLDDANRFVTTGIGWFAPVLPGWEGALPALRRIEYRVMAERSAALAARLAPPAAPALVIRDGDVFDSERGTVLPRTTVVIEGDRITQLGDARTLRIPAGARVIDARGRAVIPGLWDMHVHVDMEGEADGVMQLAAGVTTIRDMAADTENGVSVRDRSAAGTLLAPRVILAGIIEGPGAWAGPTDVLVRTEVEARAAVARYDSLGYRQVKLYNLVHPDLVPAIVEEAKARGMRVSGHIPRGLSVPAAIALGFDEVQHGAFLVSTFFQDSLYAPRMRAYSNLASDVLPSFDVEGAPVTQLIALLKEKGIAYDGTFNVYEDASCLLPDGTDPVLGPSGAWLPGRDPRPERRTTCSDTTPAQRRLAKYTRLLKRLHDGGVTIIPGTDNTPGLSLHGELELYARAGIPAPEILRIATSVPARVMHDEREHGSIAVGKVADLVIVDGRPWDDIRALRRTRTVVRAGRAYDSDALYRAVGIVRPPPR